MKKIRLFSFEFLIAFESNKKKESRKKKSDDSWKGIGTLFSHFIVPVNCIYNDIDNGAVCQKGKMSSIKERCDHCHYDGQSKKINSLISFLCVFGKFHNLLEGKELFYRFLNFFKLLPRPRHSKKVRTGEIRCTECLGLDFFVKIFHKFQNPLQGQERDESLIPCRNFYGEILCMYQHLKHQITLRLLQNAQSCFLPSVFILFFLEIFIVETSSSCFISYYCPLPASLSPPTKTKGDFW